MDVNGTRFHLLKGKADWLACREPGQTEGWDHADWFPKAEAVALKSQLSLFPRGQRDAPLKPADRRGAAADRYGNWYWISHDRKSVLWMPYQADG